MISVIITTKNAEEFIADCIKSVMNSDYVKKGGKFEIIVVDNYSTDKTAEIAKELGAQTFIKGHERSAQRNFGVEQAKGEFVGILDADMTLSPEVLGECVEIFEKNENINSLYVPEKIFINSYFNKVRNFERSFYDNTVIDCARFFRRESFLKIGGFDSSLNGPEDWDFDRRMRGAAAITKAPLFHHENLNLKEYALKKSYYASSFDKYFEKWGFDEITKKQFGLYYRYFGIFVENGKWKKLLRHPILAFSMYFVLFLKGVIFILAKFHISANNVYKDKKIKKSEKI